MGPPSSGRGLNSPASSSGRSANGSGRAAHVSQLPGEAQNPALLCELGWEMGGARPAPREHVHKLSWQLG